MPELLQDIKRLSRDYLDETISLRRAIHANPELSFEEFETTELICRKLTQWGIRHDVCKGGTGVTAVVEGHNPIERNIVLRADIDALPIDEQNDVEYRSQKSGIMHACGHDAHTAILLGVARILNELKDRFEGTVKFVFQPAEEKVPGGAKAIIESGFTDHADCMVALHVYPDLPCGSVGFCSGAYMASCDEIEITLKGRGGHAAKPAERDDMILIASELVVQLQKINGRLKPHDLPSILAFGAINADGTYNVIPDVVTIKGTFRTFNESWRTIAKRTIRECARNIATEYRIKAEVKINDGYPFLRNDDELTDTCFNLATEYLGKQSAVRLQQMMTSEDFAWYTQRMPSCFFRLGTANTIKNTVSKQHTATFDIDENAMETGMGLMSWIALNI